MSAASRRGARREQEAADLLGTERVKHRPRFASLPDVRPVRLPGGDVLRVEVKTRGKLPRWLVDALAQAGSYGPGVPVAAVSQTGGEPLAVLRLRDLARLLGLSRDDGAQLSLLRSTEGR